MKKILNDFKNGVLTVFEANATGNFTFLSGCNQIVGSFKMGASTYVVDYSRKNK